jgi:phosphatidylinositol-3-phosphatase
VASQAAAAPYISSQLLAQATLLSGWTALEASAFASEAALAEPPAAGSTPPILHSIVQPPCPEGPAGAGCAPETPGQLTAADEFLKTTLATITGTPAYKEHGLVVVTFATVGIATQSELPPGASTSQLTSEPPAGVAVLSPFAKAGARSSIAFNPTSPRQSLEKLLR